MKYSAALFASLASMVVAQQGPPQQAGYQQPCGLSCLLTPIKASSCRPAAPPPPPQPAGMPPAGLGPGQGRVVDQWEDPNQQPPQQGPPPQGPPPRASAQQIQSVRDCFCKVPNLQDAFNSCAPQACAQTRGNPAQLLQMFNGMCAQTAGYVPLKGA